MKEYDEPATLANTPGSAFGALLAEYQKGKEETKETDEMEIVAPGSARVKPSTDPSGRQP